VGEGGQRIRPRAMCCTMHPLGPAPHDRRSTKPRCIERASMASLPSPSSFLTAVRPSSAETGYVFALRLLPALLSPVPKRNLGAAR
jgi:hypothetical protein